MKHRWTNLLRLSAEGSSEDGEDDEEHETLKGGAILEKSSRKGALPFEGAKRIRTLGGPSLEDGSREETWEQREKAAISSFYALPIDGAT